MSARETWQLETNHIGKQVLFFDQLESTNTTAAELASASSDGLVVIARFQTAGRGQYGRVWQARDGSSLLMSIALHPPAEMRRPVVLTAFAAVAVAEAILELTGIQARVKWPNDLLVRGKKVCGILIENTTSTVIGLGLNLMQSIQDFATAALPDATSLAIISDKAFDVQNVARVIIRNLDAEYTRLISGERVAVEADWKWRVGLLGHHVGVELTSGAKLTGRLREMSFDALELETGDGEVRLVVPETVRQMHAVANGQA
jgi:BirA family biotin operon repressor/biotin-[acetyl-CoA-carboxylase] ligase